MVREHLFIVQLLSSFQRLLLEFSSVIENSLSSSAPDVFRCQTVQAFMVSPFIVMGHELSDLSLKVLPGRYQFHPAIPPTRSVSSLRHQASGESLVLLFRTNLSASCLVSCFDFILALFKVTMSQNHHLSKPPRLSNLL